MVPTRRDNRQDAAKGEYMLQTVAMTIAGMAYLTAAIGYAWSKQYWMAATLISYAVSIGTIYMAGNR